MLSIIKQIIKNILPYIISSYIIKKRERARNKLQILEVENLVKTEEETMPQSKFFTGNDKNNVFTAELIKDEKGEGSLIFDYPNRDGTTQRVCVIAEYSTLEDEFLHTYVEHTNHMDLYTDNPLIYDCGANAGMYSLYYALQYPQSRIEAFEPAPVAFQWLKKNMTPFPQVKCHNKAIWIHNNGIDFWSSEGNQGANAISAFSGDAQKVRVETIALADLLKKETSVIHLLKIDIEGAEDEVLCSCDGYLENVEQLQIEYHQHKNRPLHLDKILSLLQKNNFSYTVSSAFAPSVLKSIINDWHLSFIVVIEAARKDLIQKHGIPFSVI